MPVPLFATPATHHPCPRYSIAYPMMNTANTDTVQRREQRVVRETPQQVMVVIQKDLKV